MVSKVHIRKKFLNDDECFNIILNNRKNLKHETINNYHYEKSDYLSEIEPTLHRVKTFIIPLNDDFKGAEFEVENYGICDIKKGDCLEFDSRLYHRFSPITEGIRYSLAVWLLGESWSGR